MKKRIYQIAKEIDCSNQECVQMAQELGFLVTTASNSLNEEEEQRLVEAFYPSKHTKKKLSQKSKTRAQVKKLRQTPRPPSESYAEKYEKKTKKKEQPPKVKTISRRRANVLFLFMLVFVTTVLIGLGGLGIASNFRMNQLVKETNQAIQILNEENQHQSKSIQELQKKLQGAK